MSNRENEYNSKGSKSKVQNQNFTEGVNVCVYFLFSCALISMGIENFTKYGIIKGPFQLTIDLIEYIQNYWWLYIATFIGVWLQVSLCFIIENLLIWKTLSEKFGMGLHIFNSFLPLNVVAILTHTYRCSPFAGASVMLLIFFQIFKYWSYIQVNRKHRMGLHTTNHKDDDDLDKKYRGTKTISYPQNVTLMDLVEFLITTTVFTYTLNGVKRTPRNLRKAFKLFCYAVIAHYWCAFLLHQFIFPELELASKYFLNRNILNLAAIGFKLVIPIFALWLTYFYFYTFVCYLPIIGCVWGTDHEKIMGDWWNAETTTIFWLNWNTQGHMVLKDCVFVPLLKMGYSKFQASLGVFLVSGILHEYVVGVLCRTGYGFAMFGMLFQIPLAILSNYMFKNYGAKFGNLVFWSGIIIGNVGCFIILSFQFNYKIF